MSWPGREYTADPCYHYFQTDTPYDPPPQMITVSPWTYWPPPTDLVKRFEELVLENERLKRQVQGLYEFLQRKGLDPPC